MSDLSEHDIREQAKKRYQDETGEELPDHAIENLDVLIEAPRARSREPWQDHRTTRLEERLENDRNPVVATAIVVSLAAVCGLIGVYASRWFSGWPAQVAGGAFVSVLFFAAAVAFLGYIDE